MRKRVGKEERREEKTILPDRTLPYVESLGSTRHMARETLGLRGKWELQKLAQPLLRHQPASHA